MVNDLSLTAKVQSRLMIRASECAAERAERHGRQFDHRREDAGADFEVIRKCSWFPACRIGLVMSRTPYLFTLGLQPLKSLGLIPQADVFVTITLGHDAVVKCDAGGSSAKLMHLKRVGRLVADVQPLTVAFGGQEDVILDAGVHGLGENGIQADARRAVGELPRTHVFKPVFRRLDGVESHPAFSVVHRHDSRLCSKAKQIAAGVDVAKAESRRPTARPKSDTFVVRQVYSDERIIPCAVVDKESARPVIGSANHGIATGLVCIAPHSGREGSQLGPTGASGDADSIYSAAARASGLAVDTRIRSRGSRDDAFDAVGTGAIGSSDHGGGRP